MFALMNMPTARNGSAGFTPPLGAGSYTFLFQQTQPTSTNYEFNFVVAAVPEPAAVMMACWGAIGLVLTIRRRT